MENVVAIKKYFLTDNDIVIKYKNKNVETKKLNRLNLKNLINQLNKQYQYNKESISKKQDSMYSKVAYISFIITLIEGIIFSNLLISFEVGKMKMFIACSILSGCLISAHLIFLIISFIILIRLNNKYRICIGMEYLTSKYKTLFGDSIDEDEETVKKMSKEKISKSKEKVSMKKEINDTDRREIKVLTEKDIQKKQARKKKAKVKKRKMKKIGTKPKKKSTKKK